MIVNRSAPKATVVPILVYEDVEKAVDWLCGTFGFKERLRAGRPGQSATHAQLAIAEGAVMLGRQGGEFRPPRPNEVNQYVTVHVENVDAHFEHAQRCGARILKPPTDMPFGERQYTVEDPGGAPVDVLSVDRGRRTRGMGCARAGPTGLSADRTIPNANTVLASFCIETPISAAKP